MNHPTNKPIILSFCSVLLLFASFSASFAQGTSFAKQSVFAEFGGNGLIMSFNYDRRLGDRPDGLGVRVGLGGMAIGDYSNVTIPLGLNYLAGKNNRYFEAGIGATYSMQGFSEETQSNWLGFLTFGYRKQPIDKGFSWRAGFSPLLSYDKADGGSWLFLPYFPHLGIGYAF